MSTDPTAPAAPTPPPPPPPPGRRSEATAFFDRLRGLGMVRPDDGRWGAGVAAAAARRAGVDPLLVRGVLVALTLTSGGVALLLYGLGWALLPQQDGTIHAEEALHGRVRAGFAGALVTAFIGLSRPLPWWLVGWTPWNNGNTGGSLLVLAMVALGVWWVLQRRSLGPGGPGGRGGFGGPGGPGGFGGPGGGTPAAGGTAPTSPADPTAPADPASPGPGYSPGSTSSTGYTHPSGYSYSYTYTEPTGSAPAYGAPAPGYGSTATVTLPAPSPLQPSPRPPDPTAPSHRLTLGTLGVALLSGGLFALWDRTGNGLPGPTGLVAGCAALAVVAAGIVVAGVLGLRSGGLAPIGVLLALGLIVGAVVSPWLNLNGVGERDWSPRSTASAEGGYRLGVGQLNADLTRKGLLDGATAADPVRVETSVGLGELDLVVPAGTSVEVRAEVGAGDVGNDVPGSTESGVRASGNRVDRTIRIGTGDPVLVVHAKVGLGTVQVRPEPVTP